MKTHHARAFAGTLLSALLATALNQPAAAQKSGGGSAPAGVVVIDQARAEAGGVTPGDAPGLPVTITQPGSYRLAGNLVAGDANTSAIVIASANVTLDLNGYSILGPVVCSGTPLACSSAGQGDGIQIAVTGTARAGITLLNGVVRGMGRWGVQTMSSASDSVRIERLQAIGNYGGGLSLPPGTVVTDSHASGNFGPGINGYNLVLFNNVIRGNGNVGLQAWTAAAGAGNVLQGNAYGNISSAGLRALGPNLCDSALCP